MGYGEQQEILATADSWSPVRTILWDLPGPVWTLALWQGLIAVNLAGWAYLGRETWPSEGLRAVAFSAVYSGILTAVLLIVGRRTPIWLIYAIVAFSVIDGAGMMVAAEHIELAMLPIWGVMPVSVYAAFWFSRRIAYVFTAFAVVVILLVALAHTTRLVFMLDWLGFASLSVTLVIVIGALVASLRSRALTDPLTDLLNRDGLNALIELHPSAGRLVTPRTVVVIDLDGFKQINDTEGHHAGDAILKGVATAMRAAVRPDDVVARTGGDEFVVVLPATSVDESQVVVDRLRGDMPIGFSSGSADWPASSDFELAMREADQRMYEAKQRGRQR